MKINSTKWNMVKMAVNRIGNELKVDIYDFETYGEKKPIEWGINWLAQGTRTVSEAEEYIAKMQTAIKIASFLTGCGFEIDWSEKFEITEGTRDYWIRETETLMNAIKNQKLDLVWDFVEIEVN